MEDFVARAGSIIDRAHRIAGVLLICVVVLGLMTMCQWSRNASLNAQLMNARVRLPVIVVPDATSGLYSPTEDDRLILMFTDLVAQSLNSFTPETLTRQYETVRAYFAPALLADSSSYFDRMLRDSGADRRSSLFVPDRSTIKVKKYTDNDVEVREVNLNGSLQTIIGGTVAETVPVEMALKMQKTLVSPANPYGFLLTGYHVTPLVADINKPQLAGGGESGQNGNGIAVPSTNGTVNFEKRTP